MTDWIARLCAHAGVQAQYRGFDGQTIDVSRDTLVAVLRALDLDVASEADARAHVACLQDEAALRPAPRDVIVRAGRPSKVPLAHEVAWSLEAEDTGAVLASGQAKDVLSLPAVPLGIHRLHLHAGGCAFTTWVLARPARAVRLEDHIARPRIWGVLAALYGMTDGGAAPIGSYDLLGDYAARMAGHGADFLGVNPVHAMGHSSPDRVISPYSPSHRAFLNTWHCAGLKDQSGDNGTLVDYPSALQDNARALAAQYSAFRALPDETTEKRAFEGFAEQSGSQLHQFALFEALSHAHGPDWRDWPARYRDHDASALAAFEAGHADAIARSKWAQWQAERQLAGAQAKARDAGMRVGLYLDLAVGACLGGAETWDVDSALVTGATLGAPPDPLGPEGQSWGLAPQSPLKCRAEGYAGFARLLRRNMRHAGMIRIDHVLGLMRSFWIPDGCSEGAYVNYPFDALLAVVVIESVRNDAIVVGEDLGLVPEGLRDKLADSCVYGLDVLQYMRTPDGGFVDPADTRGLAVCTFATHDTPTIAGFFAAEDAQVRHRLGTIDAATLAQTRADRRRAQDTLGTGDPVQQIHRHLARAKSAMVAVQLDDIAGRTEQQNLPGTVDTYPNWQLKAPFSVNEIATSGAFAALASDMRAQGRSNLLAMEKADDLSDCSNDAH